MSTSFSTARLVAAAAALILLAGACSDDDAATTSTAAPPPTPATTAAVSTTSAPTTTTAAPTTTAGPTTTSTTTTTTTTTTTLPPPPEVDWGEPEVLVVVPDTFFAAVGDLSSLVAKAAAAYGEKLLVLAEARTISFIHQLGGFTQADSYSDMWAWTSAAAGDWDRVGGPPDLGRNDEIINAVAPFEDGLVAVGSVARGGTNPTQIEGVWTFPTWPVDAAVWLATEDPPRWEQVTQDSFAGDIDEAMHDVVVFDGLIVAVGEETQIPEYLSTDPFIANGAAWASSDGREWLRAEDPEGILEDVTLDAAVTDGSSVFAFGSVEEGFTETLGVVSSQNGLDWTRVPVEGDVATSGYLTVGDAAISELGTVVVGRLWEPGDENVAIWHSSDHSTWQLATIDGTYKGELRSVTATPFGYIAVGRERDAAVPLVLVSGDGLHWYRDTNAMLAVDGASWASASTVTAGGDVVLMTGTVGYADNSSNATVWMGPVGPGTAPEQPIVDGGTADLDVAEALSLVEESTATALASAAEAEAACTTAFEAAAAEIEAGMTQASMETAILMGECVGAIEEVQRAALTAEQQAADIENAAPGSDEALAAAELADQAGAIAEQAMLTMQTLAVEYGVAEAP